MAKDISEGKHDKLAILSAEKAFLPEFKAKYDSNFFKTARITDICFEDYFFVHDMVCRMTKTTNPEHSTVSEALRIAYIYAIYNDGKINKLYQLYPLSFISFLKEHEFLFTTNYDLNLESVVPAKVIHLHGQFDRYGDVYDIESLRNKLPDAPAKTIAIDPGHAYLYCNAITTYNGNYKESIIKQTDVAMAGIRKIARAYETDRKLQAEIDSWITSDNIMVRNMGFAVKEMAAHPEYSFTNHYHWDEFEKMKGELDILGLSPWNDFHIFTAIDAANLDSCTYFYFSETEMNQVQSLLPILHGSNKLSFRDAKLFWAKMR